MGRDQQHSKQIGVSAETLPREASALPRCRLWASTRWSPWRLVCDQAPPHETQAVKSVRCAFRVALWRRASNSVSPTSLGRAPIPPDSSTSKSPPRGEIWKYLNALVW